jgi:hypothetical protein
MIERTEKPPPLARFAKPWMLKLIFVLSVVGWMAVNLSVVWLYYLMWFGADAPNPVTGHTELMTEHSLRAYVTPADKLLWQVLMFGGFGALGVSILIGNAVMKPQRWDEASFGLKLVFFFVMLPPFVLASLIITTGGRFPFGEWSL